VSWDSKSRRGFDVSIFFIMHVNIAINASGLTIQDLAVGQTKYIGFSAGISIIESGVLNFHRNSTEDTPTTPTSYVYVTRISASPAGPGQWLMTPAPPASGSCSSISNVGALRINTVLYGYYNMPFSFTPTKIP
jgi:hypothetical protein